MTPTLDKRTAEKMRKVQALIDRGGTEGEKAAAREAMKRIKEAPPKVIVMEERQYIHSTLRPHQKQVLDQLRESQSPIIVAEAVTGSGKTFWPAQLAYEGYRVIALVRTKSLQTQYTHPPYNAKKVTGKANFDCLYNDSLDASMCKMTSRERDETPCKSKCPYYVACNQFLGDNFGSLNYSKYLLETRRDGLVDQFRPQILFLDEAHQLSDLVIDFSGCSFSWQQYGKPAFILNYTQPPSLTKVNPLFPSEVQLEQKKLRVEEAIDWLVDLLAELDRQKPAKVTKRSTPEEIKHYKKWDNLYRKVGTTIDMVDAGREHWYVQSNDEQFLLKPLTARYHFPQLFKAPKIVMMSATIGKVNPFMAELGIYENFQSIVVPNIWPPSSRPIYDLGGPKMSFRNTPQELTEHAHIIAKALNSCDPSWTGIIHTNSKAKALALRDRLQRAGVKRPLWVPPFDIGTEQALAEWLQYRERNRGAIGLVYSFTEGVDLGDDQISIVAWLSWPSFGDEYEKARFDFDPKAGLGRVANHLVQALGRVRRGREKDYQPNSNFVAVADSNWQRVKSFLSQDILESIVRF